MRRTRLEHQFVKSFPRPLEEGILYVSMEYASAAHKCCCGCGNDVITRLSPTDWRLSFNGRSISLHPSIGNWDVVWDVKWSRERIESLRRQEATEFEEVHTSPDRSWWNRLLGIFR